MEELWASGKNLFGDRLADRTSTADDQKARALDEVGKFLFVGGDVSGKELLGAPNEIKYEIHDYRFQNQI
jgi:hypothetical protein